MNRAGNNITPNKFAKELILDKMDELLERNWVEALETYDFDTGKQGRDGIHPKRIR
jgi:hypothetical protein